MRGNSERCIPDLPVTGSLQAFGVGGGGRASACARSPHINPPHSQQRLAQGESATSQATVRVTAETIQWERRHLKRKPPSAATLYLCQSTDLDATTYRLQQQRTAAGCWFYIRILDARHTTSEINCIMQNVDYKRICLPTLILACMQSKTINSHADAWSRLRPC